MQGYLIRRLKKKLKKEYLGLPGKDIKRLKDEGKVTLGDGGQVSTSLDS